MNTLKKSEQIGKLSLCKRTFSTDLLGGQRHTVQVRDMEEIGFRTVLTEIVQEASQDESLAQFRMLISAHQYLRLYRLVTRYVSPGNTVLDWGVGNGHFSYFLVRAGYTVSGFDFADYPKICGALAPESFTYIKGSRADPVSLPYESQTFDAVVSVGVLEHVRETGGNEMASLHEIYRILKPKGIFLCFHLPNQYSWIEAVTRLIGRWSHQYRYTSSGVLSLARCAGFEVVELQRYAILPRNIWWWGIPKSIGALFQMARLYDHIDNSLSLLLSPICQNYLFVARKRV
jgi:SAM-dependent methyltransferase